MSSSQRHLILVVGWCVTVSAALALRLAVGGAPWSAAESVAWAAAAVMPVLVIRAVFTLPAGSIGQVLCEAEHAGNATNRIALPRKDADGARR